MPAPSLEGEGLKPDCLVVGSLAPGEASSLAELECRADRAESAGCHAIRIPYCRRGFSGVERPGAGWRGVGRVAAGPELTPADIRALAQRRVGRLAVVASVYDLSGLEELARVDGFAMLAVPAPAAVDPRLVACCAETGLPVLLEVNLLSGSAVGDVSSRFAPGQLTLLWNQIGPRTSAFEIVEDLFALLRLRRHGRPIGYVAVSCDPVPLAVALGFGAGVVDVPIDDLGRGATSALSDFRAFMLRLHRLRKEADGALLRASDLDLIDDVRPCLVAARPIRRGETLAPEMLECRAPARGLSPALLPRVLGRPALYDIGEGDPITFGMIDL